MINLSSFRGRILQNAPLAPLTTWRVGGPAETFVIPKDFDDLLYLLDEVKSSGVPLFVLGRGSNILVSDAGLPGVTLQLGGAFQYLHQEETVLRVGASYPMPRLSRFVAGLGCVGYEHLVGIPGTVGAGVVINAGQGLGKPGDMGAILRSVTYLDENLQLVCQTAEQLNLGYRSSSLHGTRAIVTEALFNLNHSAEPTELEKNLRSILAERRVKFPLNLPNCGSVFKQPEGGQPAGWLIEKAGLKGFRVGDAQVSPRHANFIVNLGHATAVEIRSVISNVIDKVFRVHGVTLVREVVFLPEQANWRCNDLA